MIETPDILMFILGIIVGGLFFGLRDDDKTKKSNIQINHVEKQLCRRSGCKNVIHNYWSYKEGLCDRCYDDIYYDM